jgi:aminoglycoside phosphotransferase (APT) family kinase protein
MTSSKAPNRISGLARVATGREVEVFSWGEEKVVRLMRDEGADTEELIDREAAVLLAACTGGAPVPYLHDQVRIDGRKGLVVERLDPTDLLQRLGSAPWSIRAVARTLGDAHARVHAIEAPEPLPSILDTARRRVEEAALTRIDRRTLLALLETLPDGDRLLHGDFNPANFLRRIGTKEYVASDWIDAGRGHPAADVARTTVMIERGGIPESTRAFFRLGAPIGRQILRAFYLSAYRHTRELDMTLLSKWETIWRMIRLGNSG